VYNLYRTEHKSDNKWCKWLYFKRPNSLSIVQFT